MKISLLAGIVALFLVGCGKYAITYATCSSGANIVCGGAGKGYSPLTLYYDTDGIDDNGFLRTVSCVAIFVSGYRGNFSTTWDTNKFPNGVTETHTRPQGEGCAQDMEFSLQVERHRMAQQQLYYQQLQLYNQQQMIDEAQKTTNMYQIWHLNILQLKLVARIVCAIAQIHANRA